MDPRFVLITLLIKLGVAAAIATALMRSRHFKALLFREQRDPAGEVRLVLPIAVLVALGAWIRLIVPNFKAADMAFEASLLMGVIAGPWGGLVGAALVSIPALFVGEFLGPLVYLICGLVAGLVRRLADAEEVWSFSPFIDLSIYRWVRRNLRRPRIEWQTGFFLLILLLQFVHMQLGRLLPGALFTVYLPNLWVQLAIYAATVATVAVPIKIWNSGRIELKLEVQERLLLHARLDALQSQINPHFLFNTLNSISSLVRFDPDTARTLIVKLSSILRRLLSKHDAFVNLREELEFIDDYLNIEVTRFGTDRLRVVKDLDPETLDALVPSMILQPLVENALNHGLSPKLEGGMIILRSRRAGDRLLVEVEDDGVGMLHASDARGDGAVRSGIGLNNVAERLHVLYGDTGRMEITERPNGQQGTLVSLRIPVLQTDPASEPVAAARIYAERSTTRS